MSYAVITKVAAATEGGNLAMGEVYLDPKAKGGSFSDPHLPIGEALGNPMLAMWVRTPVFRAGEILVLDGNDRDQTFDTIEEAVAAARAAADG